MIITSGSCLITTSKNINTVNAKIGYIAFVPANVSVEITADSNDFVVCLRSVALQPKKKKRKRSRNANNSFLGTRLMSDLDIVLLELLPARLAASV